MKTLNFKFLALMLVASLMCVSCSKNDEPKEDDPEENTIVGYWKASDPLLSTFRVTAYMNFKSDGTYTIASSNPMENEILYGTYTVKGNKVTTLLDGEKDTSIITFVNSSKFTTPWKMGGEEIGGSVTFNRVTKSEWDDFVKSLK